MDIDGLLEDYMNQPKWAGKIFMRDEKTCYVDGLIAGAKEMQKENEQLKTHIKNVIQKLSEVLIDYEVGNYDYNLYRFYSDVFDVNDELMGLVE